jgi:NAD(P)-dependent dehydrogenase (short-subunit alcohol dehydrogenase family)
VLPGARKPARQASLAAKNAFPGGAGYNAAKAGLNLFTEAPMLDHRNDGTRVCSIMPGSVDIEGLADAAHRLVQCVRHVAASPLVGFGEKVLGIDD